MLLQTVVTLPGRKQHQSRNNFSQLWFILQTTNRTGLKDQTNTQITAFAEQINYITLRWTGSSMFPQFKCQEWQCKCYTDISRQQICQMHLLYSCPWRLSLHTYYITRKRTTLVLRHLSPVTVQLSV